MEHIYIDGTKITANANKYSWVCKKNSLKNRQKTFEFDRGNESNNPYTRRKIRCTGRVCY